MTNLGSIHGQQILREAQQQKIARRPGQQLQLNMDMPISPDCAIYSGSSGSMPGTPFENMSMNAFMHQNPNGMDYSHSPQFFSDMYMSMQNGMPGLGMMDENTPQYLHDARSVHSQQSSGMSFDARRMSQPDLRVQTQLRPHTPSHQIQTGKLSSDPRISRFPFCHTLRFSLLFCHAPEILAFVLPHADNISSTISSHTSLQSPHPSRTIFTLSPSITGFTITLSHSYGTRPLLTRYHRERRVQGQLHGNPSRHFIRSCRTANSKLSKTRSKSQTAATFRSKQIQSSYVTCHAG
jgi:hypothetical protein